MLCCDYSVLDPMCQDHNILVVAAVPCDPRREKISSLLRVVASSVQRRQITQAQKPASQIWKAFGGNSASCQPVRWAESKFPHLSPRVIAGTGPRYVWPGGASGELVTYWTLWPSSRRCCSSVLRDPSILMKCSVSSLGSQSAVRLMHDSS
jgi:hypothetical protein